MLPGLLVAAALAGCTAASDAAERAGAACITALHDEVAEAEVDGFSVIDSQAGKRVEGPWDSAGTDQGRFSCTVVPDPDDDLRGMRVTDLHVERAPSADQPQ